MAQYQVSQSISQSNVTGPTTSTITSVEMIPSPAKKKSKLFKIITGVILSIVVFFTIMVIVYWNDESFAVVEFEDPGFEAAVRDLLEIPTGDLTRSDLERVISLNVSSSNIFSLAGIEYMTDLETLYCHDNELTMLDLSKNTALTILYCYDNYLTTLILSENHNLEELGCSDNRLTMLILPQNSSLIWLNCGNNYLSSLDVSYNTKLETLSLSDNRLNELDLSQNRLLRELWCGGNNLTTLDLSNNPMLERLFCENNYFPDISAITGLDLNRTEVLFEPQR